MRIEGPVAGVVEDEDGVDFEGFLEVGEIDRAGEWACGGFVVVGEDLVEGPDAGVFH